MEQHEIRDTDEADIESDLDKFQNAFVKQRMEEFFLTEEEIRNMRAVRLFNDYFYSNS